MALPINQTQLGTYNRVVKATLLNRILLVLAFIGLFVAGAVSMEKALNITLPCGNATGCDLVANDPSSMLFGIIPVAYIGLFGYLLLAGLAIGRAMKTPYNPMLIKIGYVAAGIGTAFSLYLQYISFFRIHAVCPYCLTSAITMVFTLIGYAMLAPAAKHQAEAPSSDLAKADLWLIAGLPLTAVVSLAILGGSEKSPTHLNSKIELTVKNLVPENPKMFGPETAAITIVEFADMCCPACQKASPKVKEFAADNPQTVRIVYRHFPLPMHKYGKVAAAMGEYAAEKHKFWDFTMSVMGLNAQPESVSQLLGIARSVGLDSDDIQKRLLDTNDPIYNRLTDDINVAHEIGIQSTPTFVIFAKDLPVETAGPNDIESKLKSEAYQKILFGHA